MDFDIDDDSLDDLLRDTSANKFTKTETNVLSDEVPPNSNSQSSRKEKKSALLAELFGPSSSGPSFFDVGESSTENQEGLSFQKTNPTSASKGSLTKNLFPEEVLPEEMKFGGYVPSVSKSSNLFEPKSEVAISKPVNSQPMTTPVFQPSTFSEPKSQFSALGFNNPQPSSLSSNFTLPSSGQDIFSKPQPEKKNFVSEPVSENYPKLLFGQNKLGIYGSQSSLETTNEQFQVRAKIETNKIPNQDAQSVLPAPNTTKTLPVNQTVDPIPFTFQNVKNSTPKETSDPNLSLLKDVLESFTTQFCKNLEALVPQNEGLHGITSCLTEILKCIERTSQNWLNSANTMSSTRMETSDVEKKFLSLENKVDQVSQENVNLRARLESVENQLRENRNEMSKMKQDAETTSENHFKRAKETIQSLDDKISNQSSQFKQVDDERNRALRETNEKMTELETKVAKIKSLHQEEFLILLNREIKWLEKHKLKLKNDRKELHLSQKQIKTKFKQFEVLSVVINVRTIPSFSYLSSFVF